ncbi:Rieske 2Fe-2S domain-containing protein [Micromonospora sp. NPDC020750]|uniref:Rieske 2Fe-2S domain-containing protein n=1 Tax=unclassified Micromonospora TaxID=2617518 RepID=UPI003793A941
MTVQNQPAGTRTDRGFNLAASWYVALPSNRLRRTPKAITLFGRRLVAWRDGSGRPTVMARACPHLGASLADGKVVDGTLRCAFHHWRFTGDGACVAVPGTDRIPRGARVRAYPTAERHGYVWVWYGSAEPMFALPEFPALDAGAGFARGFRLADLTGATVRRILENTYDPDHLVELHGLDVTDQPSLRILDRPDELTGHGPPILGGAWMGAELTWPAYTGRLGALANLLGINAEHFVLRVDGWPAGQRITYWADDVIQYRLLLATTPVAPNRTVQHIAVALEPSGRRLRDLRNYLVHRPEITVTSNQDLPIFNTLETGDRHGIYVERDSGIRAFRKHYQHWVQRVADDA